jgi:A/G-specific adenine glycosylase
MVHYTVCQKIRVVKVVFLAKVAMLYKRQSHCFTVKLKKTKVTNRYFNYQFFDDINKTTILNKIEQKRYLHNLYEFLT